MLLSYGFVKLFIVMSFMHVIIRTFINKRNYVQPVSYFISTFIYGMIWMGMWAVGFVLIMEAYMAGRYELILVVAGIYSFMSTLAGLIIMLMERAEARDREQKMMENLAKNSHIKHKISKAKKGKKNVQPQA